MKSARKPFLLNLPSDLRASLEALASDDHAASLTAYIVGILSAHAKKRTKAQTQTSLRP